MPIIQFYKYLTEKKCDEKFCKEIFDWTEIDNAIPTYIQVQRTDKEIMNNFIENVVRIPAVSDEDRSEENQIQIIPPHVDEIRDFFQTYKSA